MHGRGGIGGYLLAGTMGAAAGAGAALWATDAMPKMMAHIMREMMAYMDSDACRRMMTAMAHEDQTLNLHKDRMPVGSHE